MIRLAGYNHSHATVWSKSSVLQDGPDVMFTVADLDQDDDTIEVIASRFFDRKISLYSLRKGPKPEIVFERTIDDNCGAAFSSILANLDNRTDRNRVVVDSGSTVGALRPGDSFSHLLVTSHECGVSVEDDADDTCSLEEGSLFSFKVPEGKYAWKTEPWLRATVASGFKVKGQLGNMISPGAPGFVYTFHAKEDGQKVGQRPLIAVAGDCSESAYLFRPVNLDETSSTRTVDPDAHYKLMCEIDCGGTVGSIGVGYEDFMHAEQESGYAKLYIPSFEKDKILVFALGSGEEHNDTWYGTLQSKVDDGW